jgi:hypothetical protein
MLWDGEDITNDTPAMYDNSAWSLPELWGFEVVAVKTPLHVVVEKVNREIKARLKGRGNKISATFDDSADFFVAGHWAN